MFDCVRDQEIQYNRSHRIIQSIAIDNPVVESRRLSSADPRDSNAKISPMISLRPASVSFFFVAIAFFCFQAGNTAAQSNVDYSNPARWISAPSDNKDPVDVFYLYPTAWTPTSNTQLYSDIDEPSMLTSAAAVFERQATAFGPLANLYAPYYRQANANITLGLPIDQQTEILSGVPKEDVFAALDYYFENLNDGRPFILAGHSQGSNVMLFVLSEYMKEHPEIYDRMVAAYAIGYSVTEDFLAANPHLGFANGSDDIQKIISWNTEAPSVTENNPVVLPGAISINPLNWRRDETPAGLVMNLGSFLSDASGEYVLTDGVADAEVDTNRGVVVTATADPDVYGMGGALGFPAGSFHGNDVQFYYMNIRENALRRSAVALSMYQSEIYADSELASTRSIRAFMDTISHSEMSRKWSATKLLGCRACEAICANNNNNNNNNNDSWNWFATPFGFWTRQDSHASFSGYEIDAYGVALGGVKTFKKFRYGFALGYNGQTQNMHDYAGEVEADLFHAAVFAVRNFDGLSFDASLGYSHGWDDAERSVIFPDYARFDSRASFDQDAWTLRLNAKKERRFHRGLRTVLGVGLDYVGIRNGSLVENCATQSPFQSIPGFGTNTAMRLKSSTYHSLELPISLTVDKTWNRRGRDITPYVAAAWIPELLGDRPTMSVSFVDSNVTGSFLAESIKPWDSRGRFATGIKSEGKNTSLGIDYVFDFASGYEEQRLSATATWQF